MSDKKEFISELLSIPESYKIPGMIEKQRIEQKRKNYQHSFDEAINARSDTPLVNEDGSVNIPDEIPIKPTSVFDPGYNLHNFIRGFRLRDYYINEGMYAFVSWKWVKPFVKWIGNRKCLEVMAGRGILAYALRQMGVNLITTDDLSWAEKANSRKKEEPEGEMLVGVNHSKWIHPVTEVEKLDAVEAVRRYGKEIDIMIMSWPPYMDNTAFQVIFELNKINPQALVVFIGENGGCTADRIFSLHFDIINDDVDFNEAARAYEQWDNIHDGLYLGRYTDKPLYDE